MPKSIFETMNDAYNRILGRQQTDADRRAQLDALDKGATMADTATNVYDRLHPEEAPPDQRWRADAMRDIDAQSATIAGASGDEVLLGAGEEDLLEPYTPEYALEYYGAIGDLEADNGYGELNKDTEGVERDPKTWAWGRYGITADNLHAMGFLRAVPGKKLGDDPETWTGLHGIGSKEDFWQNKNQAQERALDQFLKDMERNNARNLPRAGTVNSNRILETSPKSGVHPPLTITESGLMAAAHRAGQGWVGEYLKWLDGNGGATAGKSFPTSVGFAHPQGRPYTPEEVKNWLLRVETRLRQFEHVPYRR